MIERGCSESSDNVRQRKWASKYQEIKASRDSVSFFTAKAELPERLQEIVSNADKHFSGEELRSKVIQEIIDTEQDYANDLQVVIEVFLQPLREEENILTENEISAMFLNVEELFEVSNDLLKEFHRLDEINMGEVFSKQNMQRIIQAYSHYCGLYQRSLTTIAEVSDLKYNFSTFLEYASSQPQCKNMSLQSYLIKPVQRICKYPLLLRELIKHTSSDDEQNYQALVVALTEMDRIVTAINHIQACVSEYDTKAQKLKTNTTPKKKRSKSTKRSGSRISVLGKK